MKVTPTASELALLRRLQHFHNDCVKDGVPCGDPEHAVIILRSYLADNAGACPHVVSGKEGTSYCSLAESTVLALTKQRDELGAKLESTRSECDRYGVTLDTIAEMAAGHYAALRCSKTPIQADATERLLLDISSAAMDALNDEERKHPDTLRLDWLEKHGATPICNRAAIDAAMGNQEIADSMRQAPVD